MYQGAVDHGSSGSGVVNDNSQLVAVDSYGWNTEDVSACDLSDRRAGYTKFAAIYPAISAWLEAPAQPVVTVKTVSPSSGTGSTQSFAASFAAANDYRNLAWVQLLIAAASDGGGQSFCLIHYDRGGNQFWLYGDGGFFLGPVAPGTTSNALQNSLCALNTSNSSAIGNGANLTLNASVVFKAAGSRNVYLRAEHIDGTDTGWLQRGSWILAPAPLGNMTVAPSSGSGSTQTFTATYSDPPGFAGAAFGWEQFLVATVSNGGGKPFCFVHYDRAGNAFWMYSSDLGYFLGPVTPGTASNALSSSACSVNTAGASISNVSGRLVINLPVTMKVPMAGSKILFQRTLDVLNRDTGWVQTGSWTVP
jgi:hypothetical protein